MSMNQMTSIKIPFDLDNVKMCRCPTCPVQHNSACTQDKLNNLQETLKEVVLSPKYIPGEYCSQGIASCNDLDTNQTCICNTCQIYVEYNLSNASPAIKYCRDGKAHTK
jgi:hypothetical protein